MFKYFLYRFTQVLIKVFPIKISYVIASFLSGIVYLFSIRDRKLVKDNLRCILSDKTDKKLNQHTREVFRNFGLYLVEFFYMDYYVDREFISKNVVIENLDYLRETAKKGGAVYIAAHVGNWELGAVVVSLLGYPLVAIALPHKERPVNDLFNRQRELKGITIVEPVYAIKRCMEALKNDKNIALLADRDFSMTGVEVDFFGRRMLIPKGAALFSLKTNKPIVPIFLIRQKNGKFILQIQKPIYPEDFAKSENEAINMEQLIKHYTKIIEDKIKEYPSQWLMFRKFWID